MLHASHISSPVLATPLLPLTRYLPARTETALKKSPHVLDAWRSAGRDPAEMAPSLYGQTAMYCPLGHVTTSSIVQIYLVALLATFTSICRTFFEGEEGHDPLRLAENNGPYLLRNSVSGLHTFCPFFGLRLHPEQPPYHFRPKLCVPCSPLSHEGEGWETKMSNHEDHAIYPCRWSFPGHKACSSSSLIRSTWNFWNIHSPSLSPLIRRF